MGDDSTEKAASTLFRAEIKIIFHYNENLVWEECASETSWERTQRDDGKIYDFYELSLFKFYFSGMWNLLQLIVSLCSVCSTPLSVETL